jgi:quinol-cytochrome oxidoreductase complex cytochrome b subunit
MTEQQTDKSKETIPFYPDHITTEAWVALGFFLVIVAIGIIAAFNPVGLEEPADPMVTPSHVKPEWYFLALYQMLKYVPKTVGVIIPIIGMIIALIWPFLDRKPNNKSQTRARSIFSILFMTLLIVGTIIGWFS